MTSLQGELNPQRAMYIGNKYQVYENGYQISERGYAYNNEMINSVDSEYSTSNEEMNIDDELTMKLLQREKEIRSAVDELARLGDSPSLSVNEVLKSGDPLVYEFHELGCPERDGDLAFGTTILYLESSEMNTYDQGTFPHHP